MPASRCGWGDWNWQRRNWLQRPNGNALLRIAHGLVDLQSGQNEQAQERLREGVALAGGGVAGWFRAAMEGELMKFTGSPALLLRHELSRARETPPTKEAVMEIVAVL